jgi:hypothetical protein
MGVLLPGAAGAQGTSYATVSLSTAQVYDSNLFGTVSQDRQSDLIVRFGPSIEAGFVSAPLELTGRYAFDADRYLSRPSFSAAVARQDAGFSVRYAPKRRVALGLTASYVDTQMPRELNLESGLAAARGHAARLAARPSLHYEWNPRTTVSSDYEVTRDRLAGGIAATVHAARLGVVRRADLRNTHRLDYRFRSFGFGGERPAASHTVVVGWERHITRAAGVEVALGPRLSEGTVRPELSAAFRSRFRQADVSLGYSRTEATAIGDRGTLDVQRVAFAFTYRRARDLAVTATPAVFSVARDDRRASVHALDVEAVHQLTPRLSLAASGRISLQRGTLAGGGLDIPHHTASLKLTATLPRTTRVRPGRARP